MKWDDLRSTLIAGSVSGALADLVTHPISTVKTRMQVQGAAACMADGAKASLIVYRGPLHALGSILRTEGAGALYIGVGAVLAAAAPAQALYFWGYETCRTLLPAHPLSSFAAGFGAQLCGSIAWVPMDVVKERLQIEAQVKADALTARYGGSWNALVTILRTEGLYGLYRAYWVHQLTWAPFNGLYFLCYDTAKDFARQRDLPQWWCAPTAGVLASAATNPMDLVKTRLQVAMSNPQIFDYTGTVDATVKIVRREGFLALFDGVLSRVLLLTPRLTIAVSSYEYIKAVL